MLQAVPGQGSHSFHWQVTADIHRTPTGRYHCSLPDIPHPIPITKLFKAAKQQLSKPHRPRLNCLLYPRLEAGRITHCLLKNCRPAWQPQDRLVAQGYWLAEESRLQIQTNFRQRGKGAQNISHSIPVQSGRDIPTTGFRTLMLARKGDQLWVTGAE